MLTDSVESLKFYEVGGYSDATDSVESLKFRKLNADRFC